MFPLFWAAPDQECLAEYQSASGFYYTLLHLRLLTGRTHQIRVHCEAGHPINRRIFGVFFPVQSMSNLSHHGSKADGMCGNSATK